MKELKNKTPQELQKLIAEKRDGIREFRFGSAGSKTKNVKASHNLKKEVARIMTELSLRSKENKA
jgi:ribosomal protein L29